MIRKIFNYIGMQLGWLACAVGAARGFPWVGPLVVLVYLVLHLIWSPSRKREFYFILIVGFLGMWVDSFKKASGLLTYASDISLAWLAPPWITAMWLLFATSLNATLSWLQGRPLIAALLGTIFGPLSYVTGQRLGAVKFVGDFWLTVGILAIIWGIAVPSMAWFARWMNERSRRVERMGGSSAIS
jgi:hypothetical protein